MPASYNTDALLVLFVIMIHVAYSIIFTQFLKSLGHGNGWHLPEASITAISTNVSTNFVHGIFFVTSFMQVSSLPSEMSYHNAIAFLQAAILPMVCATKALLSMLLLHMYTHMQVLGLQQSASRSTVSGLCAINSLYPVPMVHGFVAPLLQYALFSEHAY